MTRTVTVHLTVTATTDDDGAIVAPAIAGVLRHWSQTDEAMQGSWMRLFSGLRLSTHTTGGVTAVLDGRWESSPTPVPEQPEQPEQPENDEPVAPGSFITKGMVERWTRKMLSDGLARRLAEQRRPLTRRERIAEWLRVRANRVRRAWGELCGRGFDQ